MKESGKTMYFDANGPISQVNPDLAFDNSGFLHARSIFTTAGIRNNTLLFAEAHLERLENGGEWLFASGSGFEPKKEEVRKLIVDSYNVLKKNHATSDWRMRATLFQNKEKERQIILAFSPFDFEKLLNDQVKKVQTMSFLFGSDFKKDNQKVGDYRMPFHLEERFGNPLLFCHQDGRLGEGSHANLLLKNRDGEWLTPELDENILTGIGVSHGLGGLDIKSRPIKVDELSNYVGAWFINSLRGPIPIRQIDEFIFTESEKLYDEVKSVFDKNSLKRGFEL